MDVNYRESNEINKTKHPININPIIKQDFLDR